MQRSELYLVLTNLITLRLRSLTKVEDALPAGDVPSPVRQQVAAPLGTYHHRHAIGEHLGYGIDEFLSAGRDFLFQTAKPRLKQYGGNTCVAKV